MNGMSCISLSNFWRLLYKSQREKGHSTMGQWENGKFNSLSKINKKGLLLGETLT